MERTRSGSEKETGTDWVQNCSEGCDLLMAMHAIDMESGRRELAARVHNVVSAPVSLAAAKDSMPMFELLVSTLEEFPNNSKRLSLGDAASSMRWI